MNSTQFDTEPLMEFATNYMSPIDLAKSIDEVTFGYIDYILTAHGSNATDWHANQIATMKALRDSIINGIKEI